jgi:hypothetical protein
VTQIADTRSNANRMTSLAQAAPRILKRNVHFWLWRASLIEPSSAKVRAPAGG